jgi:hypothetical protein
VGWWVDPKEQPQPHQPLQVPQLPQPHKSLQSYQSDQSLQSPHPHQIRRSRELSDSQQSQGGEDENWLAKELDSLEKDLESISPMSHVR